MNFEHMKKLYWLVPSLVLSTICVAVILSSSSVAEINTSIAEIPEPLRSSFDPNQESEGIQPYLDYLKMVRANQITGEVDINDVLLATKQARELMREGSHRDLDLQWEAWGPNNIGGRTRAILIDPNNPDRMYTGGVAGGLWMSDNGAESWYPYLADDTLAGVGVASLTMAANGDIYAGTGEPGQKAGQDSYTTRFMGEGVWKSTDGGNTFNLLPATKPINHNSPTHQWASVVALGAHPTNANVILAGTERGFQVTEDGGNTWQSLATYGNNSALLGIFQASDIKVDENAIAHICASGRYFRGSLNTFDFEEMSGSDPGQLPIGFARLMVDFCKTDASHVYIVGCSGGGQTTGIFRSTDGGTNWSVISPPDTPNEFFNPTGQQGTYDMWIAVNPADKDRCYVLGQLYIWEWTATKGWYPISENGGSTGSNPYYVHADQHTAVFHPTNPNILFIGGDGGVYRTMSAMAEYPEIPTWKSMNKGYQVTQFFAVAGGLDGSVMGGTQDNGTILVNFKGNSLLQGDRVNGGDGGFADISKTNPDAIFATSQFGSIRRSANGGGSMARYMDQNIDDDQNGRVDCSAPFVTPFRLYEELRPDSLNLIWFQVNADDILGDTQYVIGSDTTHIDNIRKTFYGEGRMILGTNCGTWIGTDALDFSDNATWFSISPNSTPASMDVSPEGDIAYVGMSNGRLFRISGLLTARLEYIDSMFDATDAGITTTLLQNFGRYISGVAVDKNNPAHVVVSLGSYGNSQYVYRSTVANTVNTVGSFTSIQSNLPTMPCYDVVIDYYNPDNIIVATELGIYGTDNAGASWTYQGNGIPSSPAFGLRQEMFQDLGGDCYVIYAGTHGRGFYRSTTLTPANCKVNVSVSEPPSSASQLHVYPNPATDAVSVTLILENPAEAELTLYNLQGILVHRAKLGTLTSGTYARNVSLSSLPAGQYLMVLRLDDERVVRKVVVL